MDQTVDAASKPDRSGASGKPASVTPPGPSLRGHQVHVKREDRCNGDGDRELRDLVLGYYEDVYRYAFRLSGKSADAEDLTQQAFLIAHRKLYQLREAGKMRAWLFAILRTCYLRERRRPSELTGCEMTVDEIPERASEKNWVDEAKLQMAVDSLPDEFKVVVLMFYFEELSYKEIAEELSLPMGTVMSRLSRAKGRLRQRLLANEGPAGRPADGVSHHRRAFPPIERSPERDNWAEGPFWYE